jgi:hypothetical protein
MPIGRSVLSWGPERSSADRAREVDGTVVAGVVVSAVVEAATVGYAVGVDDLVELPHPATAKISRTPIRRRFATLGA